MANGWVNARIPRALRCAPTDRVGAERAGPGRDGVAAARDHTSAWIQRSLGPPGVLGRRFEVIADLDRQLAQGPRVQRRSDGGRPGRVKHPTKPGASGAAESGFDNRQTADVSAPPPGLGATSPSLSDRQPVWSGCVW